jgi:hypothetical protein
MDKADAAESFASKPVFGKIGDQDVLVRSDNDVPDASGSVYDQSDLPAYFDSGLAKRARGFRSNYIFRRHLPAVQTFEHFELGWFKTRYFTMNS